MAAILFRPQCVILYCALSYMGIISMNSLVRCSLMGLICHGHCQAAYIVPCLIIWVRAQDAAALLPGFAIMTWPICLASSVVREQWVERLKFSLISELSLDILKMESWTHMGRTANIIIKDVIHVFVSISKIMRILLMGRRNREHWIWIITDLRIVACLLSSCLYCTVANYIWWSSSTWIIYIYIYIYSLISIVQKCLWISKFCSHGYESNWIKWMEMLTLAEFISGKLKIYENIFAFSIITKKRQ